MAVIGFNGSVDAAQDHDFAMRGSHVLLRDFVESDRNDFLEWASDEPMYEYMTFRFATREEANVEFERLLSHQSREISPRRHYYGAIIDTEDDLARFAGISGFEVGRDGIGQFGWYLASKFWNRGLATEATRLLLRLGFEALDVPTMTATCDPLNAASRRVLEKNGLLLIGERPERPTWRGPRPRLEFAISRDEWAQRVANEG